MNSIGIEMRPHKINVKSKNAVDNDWYFDEPTVANTVELVKYLMEKYNIDIEHVIRHYDVTEKLCPRPYVGEDINKYHGKTGNQSWSEFKRKLTQGNIKEILVKMNGVATLMSSIVYNNENYIRIRDLADAQTDDKLTVGWDGQSVVITSK